MNLVGIEEKFRYYIHRSLKHKVYLPRARTNAFEYYTQRFITIHVGVSLQKYDDLNNIHRGLELGRQWDVFVLRSVLGYDVQKFRAPVYDIDTAREKSVNIIRRSLEQKAKHSSALRSRRKREYSTQRFRTKLFATNGEFKLL